MPDMTRLAQTLRLVPDIFWIVIEDAHNTSKYVLTFFVVYIYNFCFFLQNR